MPSLLPEISGNGLWGEDTVGMMMAGIERVMKHIGMIDREVKPAPQALPEFVSMWVPIAAATGLWYSAVEVGEEVASGQTDRRDQGRVRRGSGDNHMRKSPARSSIASPASA